MNSHVRLRLHSVGGVRVIHHPDFLVHDKERDDLISRLSDVAATGFGIPRPKEDIELHVLQVDSLYLFYEEQDIVAFASFDYLKHKKKRILYASGMVVRPECQKHGYFAQAKDMAIKASRPHYLALRTQNPVIYAATDKLKVVKHVYPDGKTPPEEIAHIAEFVGTEHLGMKDFNPYSLVKRGLYGENLCAKKQIYLGRAQHLFDDVLKIDAEKGDCVLVIGKI